MFSNIYLFVLFSIVATFGVLGWQLTARSAYEAAEYTVIESDAEFEIREYPDLMLATTDMQFEEQGEDGSFMRLFRYISGANDGRQKVEMTVPVFMERDASSEPGQMAFVLPRDVASAGAPSPSDTAVDLKTRTGGRFAVIRFPGRLNDESAANAESKLREWMSEQELTSVGEAELAGYDPPWTPGPLRRNEVLIRLEEMEAE